MNLCCPVFSGLLSALSCASLCRMPPEHTSSVKRARISRGMTQQALAEKCAKSGAPVNESHISRIERGVYTPRPKLRAVLAELLGLDIEAFETSADASAGQSA
ncbi:helix-turn-helix transcriptional regulator [Streptomyces sp. NPDC005227]|uniref:helix-turn-helix transcriptional regulator n=1 Tax=Streptomyces sp. NPDC005227 TaxID=3364707 RepID=UPI003696E81A